jgi:hypothetical protein
MWYHALLTPAVHPEIFNVAYAFAPRALKSSIYSTPHAYEFYSVRYFIISLWALVYTVQYNGAFLQYCTALLLCWWLSLLQKLPTSTNQLWDYSKPLMYFLHRNYWYKLNRRISLHPPIRTDGLRIWGEKVWMTIQLSW